MNRADEIAANIVELVAISATFDKWCAKEDSLTGEEEDMPAGSLADRWYHSKHGKAQRRLWRRQLELRSERHETQKI